jgi:phosphopantetheine--protein transferase-like protein
LERRKIEFFAGRFAAKEAFFKALGIGIFNQYLEQVEIVNTPEGKPEIIVSPQLKECHLKDVQHILLSISHDGDYAVAVVLLEK